MVQSVLSCGVPVDHVETVMKPLLEDHIVLSNRALDAELVT